MDEMTTMDEFTNSMGSSESPDIPADFRGKVEQTWRGACRICDNILEFQPDLILVLMHSAQGIISFAQIVWYKTQQSALPPTARTNLAHERCGVFEEFFNMRSDPYQGLYSPPIDPGKFLARISS